jgi:hypothetical protein
MVSREICPLLDEVGLQDGYHISLEKWMSLIITQLLELTHGMWIYRNLVVHDSESGVLAIRRKEALQRKIERQIELGGEGLAEEDKWMLEVNLGNLEDSNGEREAYWLVAIEATRARHDNRRCRDRDVANRRGTAQGG